ncbi:MAG TPA: sugar phosphate isomerase/epimerase [Armatimonadota bacterium]|nr:sugar phosphate isomerase/epimerase [Armatimonadota bacterium]
MKVGYLCRYSAEEIEFASRAGFGSIQLLINPGDPLDPAKSSDDDLARARDEYAEAGIEVSALGYYGNQLDPDEAKAAAIRAHFESLFGVAGKLAVDCICTFAGRDPNKSVLDNIPAFKQVFTDHAKLAEDRGIKIGFENCPMFHYFPFRGVNIAYCPDAWDAMFDSVPSEALGLEYDPSHLICMMMDYLQIIYDYGDRIVHVHAKDAEVVWSNVHRNGILWPGAVRHRTPGMGVADWPQIISALHEVGYKGNLDIEGRHDPIYKGPRENEGLVISLRHLSQYIADEFVRGG